MKRCGHLKPKQQDYCISKGRETQESKTNRTVTILQAKSIPGPYVYLAAAYWSLTTVSTIGFGDILPITNAERAVMLFFGILLGSITSLLQVSII